MSTAEELMARAAAFHGHACPGLAIGVRAVERAAAELGLEVSAGRDRARDEELVAVVETDMCAVDAIQALLGCTFGKGNLIHRDLGKAAFGFHRRSDGRGLRLLFRPPSDPHQAERDALRRKSQGPGLDGQDRQRSQALRDERMRALLEHPLEELFELQPLPGPPPARARLLDSVPCEACGETVMETRARLFFGQTLCLPCFEARERR